MIVRGRLFRRRQWWLAALACAGVGLTHALSYGLAASASARSELLHETGHEIWPPYLAFVVVAAAMLGMSGSLTASAVGGRAPSLLRTAGRLAALQAGIWVAVEGAERLLVGHGHLSWRSMAPVVLGLAVQCLIALLGALLLALVAQVAALVRASRRRRVWPRRLAAVRPVVVYPPIGTLGWAVASPRGPPIS